MEWTRGKARTEVTLRAERIGSDILVCLANRNAHVGAVAVADYDAAHATATVSVITRAGHKEDLVARSAAFRICKAFRIPVCVVAGIHLEKATRDEIRKLTRNAAAAVSAFIKEGRTPDSI